MNVELDKIDQIRERIPVSFQDAQSALDKTDGDVVQALIFLEQDRTMGVEGVTDRLKHAASRVSGWLRKGSETRLVVSQAEEIVAELPITAGVIGAVMMPRLAMIGAVAALAGGCKLELRDANPDVDMFVDTDANPDVDMFVDTDADTVTH